MRRRDFIKVIAGSATSWPLAALAQQGERVRRIGVLMPLATDDADLRAGYAAFVEALQQLGWTDGRNVQIQTRSASQASDFRRHATDLVALAPDVIFSNGNAALPALLQVTHTVPIVFVAVTDPVGAGFIESMAHPGGNATGFVQFEYTLSGKWLELLKEIAPSVTRAAVLRDPTLANGIGQFAIIQSVAPALGVEVTGINLRDAAGDIERAVTAFAGSPNGGLILAGSALAVTHRELVIALAAKHKLPRCLLLTQSGHHHLSSPSNMMGVADRMPSHETTRVHYTTQCNPRYLMAMRSIFDPHQSRRGGRNVYWFRGANRDRSNGEVDSSGVCFDLGDIGIRNAARAS